MTGAAATRATPGTAWHVALWVNFALAFGYAVLLLVTVPLLWEDQRLLQQIIDGAVVNRQLVRHFAALENTVGLVRVVVTVAYGAAFVIWYRATRTWLDRHTGDDSGLRRHWGIVAWRVGWLTTLVLTFFGLPNIDQQSLAAALASALRADQIQLALTVVRLVLVVFLAFALWAVRGWLLALPVYETQAASTAAPRRRGPAAAFRRWRARRTTRVYD